MFKSLNRSISAPIAIIIIVALAVIAIGGVLTYQYLRAPKEEIKPTEGKEIVTDLELAENTVKGYENALKTRNKDEVLSYTTGKLKEEVQGWPPIFGTSNPHPGSCEILSSKKISENEFEVKARHFEEYTGEGRIGYNDNTYTVNKIGDKYLISSIEYGEYVEISEGGWETYKNEGYGFEVEYPKDWYIYDEDLANIYFQKGKEEEIGFETQPFGPHSLAIEISVIENPSNLTAKEWAAKEIKNGVTIGSEEEVIIDGISGVKIIPFCEDIYCEYPIVYIAKGSKIYRFSEQISDEPEVFNQILSTFRFLE